eukprot:Ihof_evm3s382 gene=Ihof_evmTU3s382
MTMWGFLFYFLCVECVLLLMLLLPYVRSAVVWVVRRLPMSAIKPYFYFIFTSVLGCAITAFHDQFQAHKRYSALDPSQSGYAVNHADALRVKWRTERNTYIAFFAVYLWIAIMCAYSRACDDQQMK